MRRATFRFHGELADFLPAGRRGVAFEHEFPAHASVKDVVESLGVPHPEIAYVTISGSAADFSAPVPDGTHVDLSPETGASPAPGDRASPPLPDPRRYVLDAHMRRLAVYLRLLGFDSRWWQDAEDAELASVAAEEHRILLTRDRGLLKRSLVVHGRFVRATNPEDQLREVIAAHGLATRAHPFTRCLRCNGLVVDIEKREVLHRLRPGTRRSYTRFRHCAACDRVFWRGAHFARLRSIVEKALPEWHDERAGPRRIR